MSLFLQQKLSLGGDQIKTVSHLSWNPVQPLLATVSDNTRLVIFSSKNSKNNVEFTNIFENRIESISWPATGAKLLAVVLDNTELYCVDAGQTANNSFKLHKYENGKNVKNSVAIQKLCWTKNGGRLLHTIGKELYGIRFEARSGIFQNIFCSTYLNDISTIKPTRGLDCVLTSTSGDVAQLHDQEIIQIAKLPSKSFITQLLTIDEDKYALLSDVLVFMDKGKVTFTVKLVKEARILVCETGIDKNPKILAYYHNEIRCFDFNEQSSTNFPHSFEANIKQVVYDDKLKRINVALTNGTIRIFGYNTGETEWSLKQDIKGILDIQRIDCFPRSNIYPLTACYNNSGEITILEEQRLLSIFCKTTGNEATQINSEQVKLKSITISHGLMKLVGLDVNEEYLLAYGSNSFSVFDVANGEAVGQQKTGSRIVKAELTANGILVLENENDSDSPLLQKTKLSFRSFQGVEKQSMSIGNQQISSFDVSGCKNQVSYIAILNTEDEIFTYQSTKGVAQLRPFKTQKITASQLLQGIKTEKNINGLPSRLESAMISGDGKVLLAKFSDKLIAHFFSKTKSILMSATQVDKFGFDISDTRLAYFTNSERKINSGYLVEDSMTFQKFEDVEIMNNSEFLCCKLPFYLYRNENVKMTSFSSFEDSELSTQAKTDCLKDFAYFSCIGSIDKACHIIEQHFENAEPIWNSLAASCLKSFRFDVAIKALQSMGKSYAVMKLRSVINDSTYNEISVAGVLATQLGKNYVQTAVELFEKGERFDLLNEFLQNLNIWTESDAGKAGLKVSALKVAEDADRIHMKPTRQKHAYYLQRKTRQMKYTPAEITKHVVNTYIEEAKANSEKKIDGNSQKTTNSEQKSGQITGPNPDQKPNQNTNQQIVKTNLQDLPNFYLGGLDWGFGQHKFDQIPAKNLTSHAGELHRVIDEVKDLKLYSWWAQFNEHHSQWGAALLYYKKGDDIVNSTKLLCNLGKKQQAKDELALFKSTKMSDDGFSENEKVKFERECAYKGACYRIAYCEEMGDAKESVRYYQMADAPHSAIQVAKNNELDDVLMMIAMQSSNRNDIIETAQYYEGNGHCDKAAQLYIRGGDLYKGFSMVIESAEYNDEDTTVELIDNLIDVLGVDDKLETLEVPRQLLNRCASVLMKNNKIERAVELLARLGDFEAAYDILEQYDVEMNQHLVSVLDHSLSVRPSASGQRLQERLADHAMQNGHYRLAAQKFSESGKYKSAIKALCRSGDIQEIIKFTNRARQKEVYVAAANYLKTADYSNSDEILQSIQTFYTKAKEFDKLSSFLKNYASRKVNSVEEKDYDRALWALTNALKAGKKAGVPADEDTTNAINILKEVTKFERSSKPEELLQVAVGNKNSLVSDDSVFAFLAESFDKWSNLERSREFANMIESNDLQSRYLSGGLLSRLGLGKNVPRPGTAAYVMEDLFS